MITLRKMEEVMEYLNSHGFYFVSNPEQQEIVDQLVENNELRPVDPSWVDKNPVGFYVHNSVDSRQKLPIVLQHLIVKPEVFKPGEIVYLSLRTHDSDAPVEVLATIDRQITENRYEVVVQGSNTCLYVSLQHLRHTYS